MPTPGLADDFRRDQRASRRAGGSGDPDAGDSGDPLEEFLDFATRNRDDPQANPYSGYDPHGLSDPADEGGVAYETGEDAAEAAQDAVNEATSVGPDWLDEATVVVGALLVLVALRPYASAGAAIAD
jgi:hypothetical protein